MRLYKSKNIEIQQRIFELLIKKSINFEDLYECDETTAIATISSIGSRSRLLSYFLTLFSPDYHSEEHFYK